VTLASCLPFCPPLVRQRNATLFPSPPFFRRLIVPLFLFRASRKEEKRNPPPFLQLPFGGGAPPFLPKHLQTVPPFFFFFGRPARGGNRRPSSPSPLPFWAKAGTDTLAPRQEEERRGSITRFFFFLSDFSFIAPFFRMWNQAPFPALFSNLRPRTSDLLSPSDL